MKLKMQLSKTIQSLNTRQIYFMIICVGLILYGKSIFYDYTHMDDTHLLVMNQAFIGKITNLPKLFTTDVFISLATIHTYYRPLMNVLFMLEAQVAQDNPLVYHVTNVLLHIGCSLLLFTLFQQLRLSKMLSALAALVFCVHPLHTSAVVWIPGRNDTLLTLFVLSSFLFFLRAQETKRQSVSLLHILFFFFALLVKESAIVLPLLCLGYIYYVKGEKVQRSSFISLITAYVVVLVVWIVMRTMVYQGFAVHNVSSTLLSDFLRNLPAYFLYIGKIFVPMNLSIFPNLADHSLIPGIFCVLLFAGLLLVVQPPSYKFIVWGIFWFFLFLSPSLAGEPVFYEHRAYCSMIGLLAAIAYLPAVEKLDFSRSINAAGIVVLLLFLSLLTFFYENSFRDRQRYALSAYATAPSADNSSTCLASLYLDEGKYPEAEEVILAEIKRKPRVAAAHRILGDIYAKRHEYDLAAREYELSLQFEPLGMITYVRYGMMNLETGQIDAAAHLWKTTIQINPDYLLGYYYLANFYIHTKNDPDSAMIYVRELQQRGETVLPELLNAIETHPLYLKKNQ
jgi:protein O-mannosyl-transferase